MIEINTDILKARKVNITKNDFVTLEYSDLDEIVINSLENERRKREQEVYSIVYQYLITRFTKDDIKNVFSDFQTFDRFMDEITSDIGIELSNRGLI